MRQAKVYLHDQWVGVFTETDAQDYVFEYLDDYQGQAISLTIPVTQKIHRYKHFPAFFDGLLPEGVMLEGLLRQAKIDRNDYFSQLITVGQDLVGAVTVEAMHDN
jgi:serine/threonine-protein kinase HipA